MIPVNILIDSSGSMNENAKLVIARETIKTLNLYHLVSSLSFSLNIYQWGEEIKACRLDDIAHIECDKKNNFDQLINWLFDVQDTLVFIISDGNFTKSQLDNLKKNAAGLLDKVYFIIVEQEDIASLRASLLFDKRIFLSSHISALIATLEMAHPEIITQQTSIESFDTETFIEDDWA